MLINSTRWLVGALLADHVIYSHLASDKSESFVLFRLALRLTNDPHMEQFWLSSVPSASEATKTATNISSMNAALTVIIQ